MTRTPTRPHRPRRTVTADVLVVVGVQTGTASARPDAPSPVAGTVVANPDPGSLRADLSPAQRSGLTRSADVARADTATSIGLSAEKKLVVKDVVEDVVEVMDGAVHTRYERTCGDLPGLGGDLAVQPSKSGAVETVTRATKKAVKAASTTASIDESSTVEKSAVAPARAQRSRAQRSEDTAAAKAPRKVIRAVERTPETGHINSWKPTF